MRKYTVLFLMFMLFLPLAMKAQNKSNDSVFKEIQHYLYENPDKAIEVSNKIIDSEKDPDKKLKYYLFLSKAYTAKRNSDASYKTLLKAQQLLEDSKDFTAKIDAMILIAIQYEQMELYTKSFEVLDQVDALCNNLNAEYNLQKNSWLGKSYAIKGIIYKSQKNNEIALKKFFTSIQNFEKAEQTVPTINNISIVYYNIGYTFINVNNFAEAEKYFNKSLIYAQKSKAHSLEAYALKGLADLNSLQDNPQKAVELLETAKVKAQNIGDLVLSEGIYKGLADNYLSIGNFQKHVEYNDLYKKAQFEKEQNELQSINSFIDNTEKEKTEKLETDNKKHLIINILISIFTFLILGFFVFKIVKKYKKNQALRKQIQELITR